MARNPQFTITHRNVRSCKSICERQVANQCLSGAAAPRPTIWIHRRHTSVSGILNKIPKRRSDSWKLGIVKYNSTAHSQHAHRIAAVNQCVIQTLARINTREVETLGGLIKKVDQRFKLCSPQVFKSYAMPTFRLLPGIDCNVSASNNPL